MRGLNGEYVSGMCCDLLQCDMRSGNRADEACFAEEILLIGKYDFGMAG